MLPLTLFLVVVLVQPKHLKGELPIDAYLKVGFGIGMLCALGGVAFIWLWEFYAQSARRKEMRQLGADLGFSYMEATRVPPDLLSTYPLFVEFGYVYPSVQNALQGTVNGSALTIFDYRHPEYLSSGGGTHAGQVWKFFDTVIVIRGSDQKPHVSKFRYGLAVGDIRAQLDILLNDL